jgi:glycosyltransferase involved in cell wall biosynthesis
MRALVITFDPVTEAMPGPAIRAWHLALELAKVGQVVLASTSVADRTHPDMDVRTVNDADLGALVEWATVVFAPTSVVRRHRVVAEADIPLCIDMYIPTHLENLEAFGEAGSAEHHLAVAHQVSVIGDDLRRGDFFLCASERQRDFWLGSLATLGRVNPATYGQDPNLLALIDVVPFGIPAEEPARVGPGVRETFPGIGPDDPVVIWAGGVYNWFDPISLVEAVDRLRGRIPNIRLVFLGMRHPNPDIPEMRVAVELRQLSDRRGLTDTHVFFNQGWVPYDQRATFLLDADIGVSTHLAHLETRFSFRTRVLDYLWAGLPSVLTAGDTLSEEIDRSGIGVAVPPGDPDAIADAIFRLLESPPSRQAVAAHAEGYRWPEVAVPLVRYASAPWRAADHPWAQTQPDPSAPAVASGPAGPSGPAGEALWPRAWGAIRPYAGRARRAGRAAARAVRQRYSGSRGGGSGGPGS